jgi:hypothetical protein
MGNEFKLVVSESGMLESSEIVECVVSNDNAPYNPTRRSAMEQRLKRCTPHGREEGI